MIIVFRLLVVTAFFGLAACDFSSPNNQDQTSTDHVELARAGYEAFAQGDLDGVLALMDGGIVWYEAESLPYGGVYHGPDEVRENIFMAIGRDWDDYVAEPKTFIDGGDHVTVIGEYRGTHRQTGGWLAVPFAHIWRFEDGLLVEFWQFTDTAAWLSVVSDE